MSLAPPTYLAPPTLLATPLGPPSTVWCPNMDQFRSETCLFCIVAACFEQFMPLLACNTVLIFLNSFTKNFTAHHVINWDYSSILLIVNIV